MRLPILISVPHAGTKTPPELTSLTRLAECDVIKDGDEQAAEIYLPLRDRVAHLETTDVARAFVDLNRAPDDFRKDGIVKTHTCWDVPIYHKPPDDQLVAKLLERYYYPYHGKLRDIARKGAVRVGIDCHTMATHGPPVGPDAGQPRPLACVSDADGACQRSWTEELARQLTNALGSEARINDPFKGGYIARTHSAELPWLQLEISRGDFATAKEKAKAVLTALENWVSRIFM